MRVGTGQLTELTLENGHTGGRLLCPQNLIPGPGQYLLAHDPAPPKGTLSASPLPVPVFSSGLIAGGFSLAPPIPVAWKPGVTLSLRGPLGKGLNLPASARRVALIAMNGNPYRLLALLAPAFSQGADVTLLSKTIPESLPADVEVQPLNALSDAVGWADYLAFDVMRESLPGLWKLLEFSKQAGVKFDAQVLVVTPMPCGGMAECGVCAVTVRRGWKMACKDGPVFNLSDLRRE